MWQVLLLSEIFVVMHFNSDRGTGQQLAQLHVNYVLTTTMMMYKH